MNHLHNRWDLAFHEGHKLRIGTHDDDYHALFCDTCDMVIIELTGGDLEGVEEPYQCLGAFIRQAVRTAKFFAILDSFGYSEAETDAALHVAVALTEHQDFKGSDVVGVFGYAGRGVLGPMLQMPVVRMGDLYFNGSGVHTEQTLLAYAREELGIIDAYVEPLEPHMFKPAQTGNGVRLKNRLAGYFRSSFAL